MSKHTPFSKESGNDWFIDQYGYISRFEPDEKGKHSVTVANWQPAEGGYSRGSCSESVRLVNAANAAADLYAALQSAAATIQQLVDIGLMPENNKGLRDARAALAKVESA